MDPDRQRTLAQLQRALGLLARRVVVPRAHERIARRAGVEIEFVEAVALARVVDEGALRLSDLARLLAVGCSTAGRHAAHLAERNLCVRTPDPLDARAVVVSATDEGRALVARLRAGHSAVLGDQLAAWDERDLARLAELAARLAADLDPDLDPDRARDRDPVATLARDAAVR
jgi:DNA-binding MarR family transcriptional regulator